MDADRRLDFIFAALNQGRLADEIDNELATIAARRFAVSESDTRPQRSSSRHRGGREHTNVTQMKKKRSEQVLPEIAAVRAALADLPEVRYIRNMPDVAGSFRVGVQEVSRRTKEFTAHVALHADALRNYKRKEGRALGLRGQAVVDHFLEEGVVLLHAKMPNISDVFRQQISQVSQRRSVRYA